MRSSASMSALPVRSFDRAGGAAPYRLGHLLACHVPGEDDDGNARLLVLDEVDAACAVHSRHDEVQQQRIRPSFGGQLDSLTQTACLDDLRRKGRLPQVIAKRFAKQIMVIGEYEPQRAPPVPGGYRDCHHRLGREEGGQVDREPAACGWTAMELDGAAVTDYDAVDDGESETGALAHRLRRKERLEGTFQDVLPHSHAVVATFDSNERPRAHAEPLGRLDVDDATLRGDYDRALASPDRVRRV